MNQLPEKAIYTKDSNEIASGKKTAIVTVKVQDLSGQRALITRSENGACIPGVVEVSKPEPVKLPDFDAKRAQHGITPEDRERWWPLCTELYLHSVKYIPFDEPISLNILPSLPLDVDLDKLPFEAGLKTVEAEIISCKQCGNHCVYTVGVPLEVK